MRLFIVSYQKSGTHQIMPAFDAIGDIVDRSHNGMAGMPEYLGLDEKLNYDGIEETCEWLRKFEDKAFGHVTYLPQYAEAIQTIPTRVLFNIRDPRDVIISEYYKMKQDVEAGYPYGWMDFFIREEEKRVYFSSDPISYLIEFSAARWPRWIGWLQHEWCLPVKYEDLRLNGRETLEKIRDWLYPDYHIDVDACYNRLLPRPKNPTFRRGIPGEWMTKFTPENVKKAEKYLGEIITTLGYEV